MNDSNVNLIQAYTKAYLMLHQLNVILIFKINILIKAYYF